MFRFILFCLSMGLFTSAYATNGAINEGCRVTEAWMDNQSNIHITCSGGKLQGALAGYGVKQSEPRAYVMRTGYPSLITMNGQLVDYISQPRPPEEQYLGARCTLAYRTRPQFGANWQVSTGICTK